MQELIRRAVEMCRDIPTLCQTAGIPYDPTSKRFDPADHGCFTYKGLIFWLRPKSTDATRPHRLYITCPACQRHVPVGRYGQHANTVACKGG